MPSNCSVVFLWKCMCIFHHLRILLWFSDYSFYYSSVKSAEDQARIKKKCSENMSTCKLSCGSNQCLLYFINPDYFPFFFRRQIVISYFNMIIVIWHQCDIENSSTCAMSVSTCHIHNEILLCQISFLHPYIRIPPSCILEPPCLVCGNNRRPHFTCLVLGLHPGAFFLMVFIIKEDNNKEAVNTALL